VRLKIIVLGLAGIALLGSFLIVKPNKGEVTTADNRDEDKASWVNARKKEQQAFYTDYVNGMVRLDISVYDLDPEVMEERYGQDLQPFAIYTKEGYRFVARYRNGQYGWSFIPPYSAQIYNYSELSGYLASVKKNQIP